MIRRPPRSTLFPYARSSDLDCRRQNAWDGAYRYRLELLVWRLNLRNHTLGPGFQESHNLPGWRIAQDLDIFIAPLIRASIWEAQLPGIFCRNLQNMSL